MTLWKSLSASFVSALRHPRVWLLQFFGNVAIFLLFIWWLNFPDAYWWQLLFTLLVALLLVVSVLALHGGTLNYYWDISEDKNAGLLNALNRALKPTHLLAFAIWAFVLHFLFHLISHLDAYQYAFPGYLRSEFPAWLRRLISEKAMDNCYATFVGFLHWVVLPGLLLPLGLLCADKGFRGIIMFRVWWRTVRNWAYWIVLILAAIIGVYCVGKIMGWLLDPRTATLGGEKTWLSFRMFFAYLLALFSWLWVCSMLGRARPHPEPPAESQKAVA